MARRQTRNITGIKGTGVVDASPIWRVFECTHAGCDQLMKVSQDDLDRKGAETAIACPKCGVVNNVAVIAHGAQWKYCRVCGCPQY